MEVYQEIRGLIVFGTYPAGRPVTELELCERLGVSRTPVREALRRLESDGLVRPARRGVTVVELDTKALRDVYLMRASLEALTAELVARRQRDGELSPASLARLAEHADLADQATRQGDLVAGVRHNREFHRYVATLADNQAVLEALDRIWDQITVSTRASLSVPARPVLVDGEHRRLIEAITDGHPAEAAAHAREHVLATMSVLTEQGEET
ncbi:GntR family transcriptional regulator [Amycolatopsis regifaucium]|uniref:GntR family transcriptional regulator n=1 Tax=Amycolatopsis regifaucium TaxID=546365 RepID=A0A154MNP2_9PSEU|nr:GntR family transcriptional regulator [Amycolatopsis regifaucium]KZB85924.1 GntR family transcriptional regulator [Amycolatopsis regifaucium]OKA04816.1 GntR family transcriptional regulator [Amycolatopsis regifaucium]SFH71753.1 DNA-binding transcriptional regulator, GntR family [Amycolatopsis regifaucium]